MYGNIDFGSKLLTMDVIQYCDCEQPVIANFFSQANCLVLQ